MKLIHISTDFVFNGFKDKPYIESDFTSPLNIYGESKLAGELAITSTMKSNAIIIRTSWVYSEYGNNFVSTILRLGRERNELNVVSDQIGSPTYATDLGCAILEIVKNKEFNEISQATQIYHYSNKGEISWCDFAKEIFKIAKVDCKVNSITMQQYPMPAKRPKNTIMSKDKIAEIYNVNIPDWKASLYTCMKILKDHEEKTSK